jgi:hypothetical protein
VPLLLTQPAAAQDCFCGITPTFGLGMTPSTEDAPETPDTTIVSVLMVAHVAMPVAPLAPEALWCTSANDPRCMPMQPSDAPALRALGGGPVAIAIDLPRTRFTRIARTLGSVTPAEGLAPALGVQRSLDRPPRG